MEAVYEAKVKNTQLLFSMGGISIKNTIIPYRLFYFGIDLEYCLYLTTNNTDEYKDNQADMFNDRYGDDSVLFKSKFDAIPSIADTYIPSWEKDELVNHAFDRISNFKMLFDWIDQLVDRKILKN